MSTRSSGKLLQDLCALEVQRGSPLYSTFIPSRTEIDRPHLIQAQRVLALARRV